MVAADHAISYQNSISIAQCYRGEMSGFGVFLSSPNVQKKGNNNENVYLKGQKFLFEVHS